MKVILGSEFYEHIVKNTIVTKTVIPYSQR